MKLNSKEKRGVPVLEVYGKLIGAPENPDQFRDYFKNLVASGEKKVVVNLGDVSWATSQGIGILIGAYTSMTNAGGTLVLSNVGVRIKDILKVTRLIEIFEIFDSEDAAIDRLADGPGSGGAVSRVQRLDTAPQLQPLKLAPRA